MSILDKLEIEQLLENLPVATIVLSSDSPNLRIIGSNREFYHLAGVTESEIEGKSVKQVLSEFILPENDAAIDSIMGTLRNLVSNGRPKQTGIVKKSIHIKDSKNSETSYLQFKCSPIMDSNGVVNQLLMLIEDVSDAVSFGIYHGVNSTGPLSADVLQTRNDNLVDLAEINRVQFDSASKELDDFVYSVSHDLRAPLRRIDGFSQELIESYMDNLDDSGQHYLRRIRQGAQDMGHLIDDLLKLSRISRRKVERTTVDLGKLAEDVFKDIQEENPGRDVDMILGDDLITEADEGLLKIVFTNLLSNAVKFTRNVENARITIGSTKEEGSKTIYVKDNGVGFDPAYTEKLFKAFQRLHSQQEYDGTGIGLVTVKRIISSHGGRVWAESASDEGATFYFTLM